MGWGFIDNSHKELCQKTNIVFWRCSNLWELFVTLWNNFTLQIKAGESFVCDWAKTLWVTSWLQPGKHLITDTHHQHQRLNGYFTLTAKNRPTPLPSPSSLLHHPSYQPLPRGPWWGNVWRQQCWQSGGWAGLTDWRSASWCVSADGLARRSPGGRLTGRT